ncbi:MAG: hypothetical protein Q8L02_06215 [Candidatus Nitrotoga sp.]|nr:hypothetical protein [Candidatus Nitrotoga sp.]
MPALNKRLARLEQNQPQEEDLVIMFSTYDTVALGWCFDDAQGQRRDIMRKPGESDEDLEVRASAIAQAARPGLFVWLNQIDDLTEITQT